MKKPSQLDSDLVIEWYGKLKEAGFSDIEKPDGSLKTFHSRLFTKHGKDPLHTSPVYLESKAEYYLRATQFLTVFRFASKIEKEIWMMHSDGKSTRVIALHIRHKDPGANKDKISGIIRNIRIAFKKYVLKPEESYEENRFNSNQALQARR